MDCIVHGVAKSQTHLSDFHFQTSSGLPQGLSGKASACSAGATGDLDLVPGSGRSLGGGHGNPLQYSGLESSMDCIVHGVTRRWTQLSAFHFTT